MEFDQIQIYKQKFLEECQKMANGLTSIKITNKQIGCCFNELKNQEGSTILEHLTQDGLIEPKHKDHFLDKIIIKSFVLTLKGLSQKSNSNND